MEKRNEENNDELKSLTLVSSVKTAKMLGIRPQTLRIWRQRGKGPPFVRMGENLRCPAAYRLSDVEEWIQKHSYISTAQETVRTVPAKVRQ